MNLFENLSLPQSLYLPLLEIIGFCYLFSFIIYLFLRKYPAGKMNALLYQSIPKLLIDLIAIVFVFLWNPGSQNYEFVLQDKMLLTTFLVGATAIIDFISTLIFLIEGTLTEIKNENENIDIKQLENRIDELEVKLATIKTPEHSSVNNIEHLSTKENSLSSSKCDK
jgi:hypothetical protein